MCEEIDVFFCLNGHKAADISHSTAYQNHLLLALRIELRLNHLCAHLSHKVLANCLHFESSPVKFSILPKEFRRCRIILCIIFTTRRQSVDIKVLELIHTTDCVMIKQTEACSPSFEHIISKDVKLLIVWLTLQNMDTFWDICSKDPATFFNFYWHNRRREVLVLQLSQKLLQSKLINPQNITHTGNQSALKLVKRTWDILARCTVQQF